jgi:hypothetical protein
MTPLHLQRSTLLDGNAKLIREWFRELTPVQQLDVLKSLLRKFSITELQTMNVHLQQQVNHQVGLRTNVNLQDA